MSDVGESKSPVREAEWGPGMDRQAHIQGYLWFLRATILVSAMVALVLIVMALFLT